MTCGSCTCCKTTTQTKFSITKRIREEIQFQIIFKNQCTTLRTYFTKSIHDISCGFRFKIGNY